MAVARTFAGRATGARPAFVDDGVGLVVEAGGQLRLVLRITVADDVITQIEAVADPARLHALDLRAVGG